MPRLNARQRMSIDVDPQFQQRIGPCSADGAGCFARYSSKLGSFDNTGPRARSQSKAVATLLATNARSNSWYSVGNPGPSDYCGDSF